MATGVSMSPRLLEQVRNVLVTYKGTVGAPVSLADISKIARIEPITVVSSTLAGEKDLYNILHGVLNIYTAYYLQAIHILSAQLADVRILKILDKTNPDRDIKTMLTSGYIAYENMSVAPNVKTLSLENAKYRLPSVLPTVTTEHIFDEDEDTHLHTSIKRIETFERLGSAIGKVVEVNFNVKGEERSLGNSVSIPVVVKLDTMVVPGDALNAILTSNKDEITLGSRFRKALDGRIEFIKDFLLCSDLITSQKKAMIKDPTGAYAANLKRINNSRVYSALTGNISLAGVSSVFVISEEEEEQIQRVIGGRLTNENTRKMVFDNISAMMIVVIDRSWSRVSMYIRDVNGFSQSSFDSFKTSVEKSDSNIQDILKAFTMSNSPSF